MALVSDRQMIFQQKINRLLQETDNEMEADSKQNELARYRMLIDDEISKRRRYKVYNFCVKNLFSQFFNFRLKILDENITICHLLLHS